MLKKNKTKIRQQEKYYWLEYGYIIDGIATTRMVTVPRSGSKKNVIGCIMVILLLVWLLLVWYGKDGYRYRNQAVRKMLLV